VTDSASKQLRIAVVMNGGVSLAVWIGGVAYELWRFAQRKGEWGRQLEGVQLEPRIDVLAGTSAGGINAVFLALATLYPEHENEVDRPVIVSPTNR
jgi:predicted acylesterase/phospholipase RssA